MDKQELINLIKGELGLHPEIKDVEETDDGLVIHINHVSGFTLTISPRFD